MFCALWCLLYLPEHNRVRLELGRTRLVLEEKVAVVPGSAFGESGEGFIRISYAYSIEELKEAFEHIKSFIERLRAEKKSNQ